MCEPLKTNSKRTIMGDGGCFSVKLRPVCVQTHALKLKTHLNVSKHVVTVCDSLQNRGCGSCLAFLKTELADCLHFKTVVHSQTQQRWLAKKGLQRHRLSATFKKREQRVPMDAGVPPRPCLLSVISLADCDRQCQWVTRQCFMRCHSRFVRGRRSGEEGRGSLETRSWEEEEGTPLVRVP